MEHKYILVILGLIINFLMTDEWKMLRSLIKKCLKNVSNIK